MFARRRLGDGVGKWKKWDEDSIEHEEENKKTKKEYKKWGYVEGIGGGGVTGCWLRISRREGEEIFIMIFFIVSKYYSLP